MPAALRRRACQRLRRTTCGTAARWHSQLFLPDLDAGVRSIPESRGGGAITTGSPHHPIFQKIGIHSRRELLARFNASADGP